MSLVFRLINNNVSKHLLMSRRYKMVGLIRTISQNTTTPTSGQGHLQGTKKSDIANLARALSSKSCSADGMGEGHDAKNMRMGRPQSPHLTIYKPQLTAVLSISHRGTGMILAGYTVLFALLPWILPNPISHYLESFECDWEVGMIGMMILKAMLAFPLVYHFWNGIRHLFWDMGMFLNISQVYMTGYIMLLLVGLTTAALCVM